MKGIKRMLNALAILSFVTVAGTSVVACGENKKEQEIKMSDELLSLLGVYDENNNSTIKVKISYDEKKYPMWVVDSETRFSASFFLEKNGAPKSNEAAWFLKETLGLSMKSGLFDENEVGNFDFIVKDNISPNVEATNNDFVWHHGSVDGYWTDNFLAESPKKLYVVKDLPIRGLENWDAGVRDALPFAWSYRGELINDFDTSDKSLLAGFKTDTLIDREKFEFQDITNLLKKETTNGQRLLNLVDFLGKGDLKIKTETIKRGEGNSENYFQKGDQLRFTVSIGSVLFPWEKTEYYFLIKDNN